MKKHLLMAFLFTLPQAASAARPAQPQATPRPNMVIILADDLGSADVGFNRTWRRSNRRG